MTGAGSSEELRNRSAPSHGILARLVLPRWFMLPDVFQLARDFNIKRSSKTCQLLNLKLLADILTSHLIP